MLVNAAGGISFWLANNETYLRYGKEAVVLGCGKQDQRYRFCAEQAEIHRLTQSLTPVEAILERERLAWQRGLAFIRHDLGRFMQLTLRKFFEFWSPYPNAVNKETGQISATRDVISMVTYGPLLCLALLGMVWTLPDWRRYFLIYAYIGILTCTYMLFLPTTRYRLPLEFFLALFAAYALWRLSTVCSRTSGRWGAHVIQNS
jgi:hypothetical protein